MRCGEESREGSQGVSDDKRIIRAMAAHLCDVSGALFRGGSFERADAIAGEIRSLVCSDKPESVYRVALALAGVSDEGRDAAVAAILDGRHPADSLPGQVERMRDEAKEERDGLRSNETRGMAYYSGKVSAADDVLALLGCKVTP
jgi:hypothetical protein